MRLGSYLGMLEAGDIGAMLVAKSPITSNTSITTNTTAAAPSAAVIASYCEPTSEFYSPELCARYRTTSATGTTSQITRSLTANCPTCPTCAAPTECPTCPTCPTCPPATAAESGGLPWWLIVLAAGAGYYFGRRG